MAGRFLLDTSVVIHYRANDPNIVAGMSGADEVFVSIVALGELLFGALQSGVAFGF